MQFPLRHRQAIGMGTNAPDKHRVAINVQMMRCDRCSDIGATAVDKLDRLFGGDMFEHDLQAR